MRKVPKLRFKEFTDEWEENKLGDIIEISNLKYNPLKEKESYPCIELESLSQETGKLLNIFDSLEQKSIKNKFQKEEVLFGKLRPYLKKYYFTEFEGVCSSEIWVFTSKINIKKFLYYFIQTEKFLSLSNTTSGTKMPRADWNLMKGEDFLIPYLEEQEKIANFLSSVDKKISLTEEKLELFREYKKGVMQKIFSQELRFKDNEGNDYPEWEEKRLEDILIENKQKNIENKYKEVFSVAKLKGVVNQIEHLGRSFASKDISNYKIVNPYDVIYTKSPVSDFPYGIIKQNKLNRVGVVSVLYAVFKPKTSLIGLLLDYYFSLSKNTNNYLYSLINKGAKNTININNDVFLKGNLISLPSSLEEQQKIANFLSSIDEKIEKIENKLENLKEFKKGLLQQMFV